MKKIQYTACLALLLMRCFSAGAQEKTNDYSGTWVINIPKSEFNGAPEYTASKRLIITQTEKNVTIIKASVSDAGTDSAATENFAIDDAPFKVIDGNKQTRTSTITWTVPRQILTETTHISFPNDPGTEKFQLADTWYLTDNNKTLTIRKVVKVYNGSGYTVIAVYEKQ